MQHYHEQEGTFHVTIKTNEDVRWCTNEGISEMLIDDFCKTRDVHGAKIHAFCILPNHVHLLMIPGSKGLSRFIQSFKSNSTKHIQSCPPLGQHPPLGQRGVDPTGGYTFTGWSRRFHDERIRDSAQRSTAPGYIQGNAMKHGLVTDRADWPWTSLHFPQLLDPMEMWLD